MCAFLRFRFKKIFNLVTLVTLVTLVSLVALVTVTKVTKMTKMTKMTNVTKAYPLLLVGTAPWRVRLRPSVQTN